MITPDMRQKILAAVITAAIVGGASWLTAIHTDIATLKAETRATPELLRDIDQRLSRIEGALGVDRRGD